MVFNGHKFCTVVGFQNDYAQLSLEDVLFPDKITSTNKENEKLKKWTKLVAEHYNAYKGNYSGNIGFDADYGNRNSNATVKYAPLQVVFIFFDTATYDEIERDVKVTSYLYTINER